MKEGTEEKNLVVINDDKDELGEFLWRIFSQSGIILRPHRSKLCAKMVKTLLFFKCNEHAVSVVDFM